MAKYNILTDKLNNYFTNNSIKIASAQPSTGTWKKGDLVISSTLTGNIFGWICTAAGTPGTWMVLKSSSDLVGDVTSHNHDTRYYTKTEVDTKLSSKSDNGHTHDDRYYTEGEVNNLLGNKSDTWHSHDDRYYTESEVNNLLNNKSNNGHTHDDRYYTEWEINNMISVQGGRKLHVQDGDPGAVGAGHIWIKTN